MSSYGQAGREKKTVVLLYDKVQYIVKSCLACKIIKFTPSLTISSLSSNFESQI